MTASNDLVLGIGAQKAATTSVWRLLTAQHWFLPARRKELQFFSYEHHRGEDWYWQQFPDPVSGMVRGEVTPDYLLVPQVAYRMHRVAPQARLFAVLRHPVDRAFSAYVDARRLGHLPRRMSFEEALRLEAQRRGRPYAGLFEGGLYARQLRRFLEFFPRERIHVEFFEELVDIHSGALGRLLAFAAAGRPVEGDGSAPLPHENAGRHGQPQLEPETRALLLERYAPENSALAALLGRDLPRWDR